ncbi:MAG: FTR1 family iron permease [Acidimicrobiales bacterium]
MIPTFIIFLREGIEASMIVAILLAYLDKVGERRHFRDVVAGVAAAMVLVVVGGVVAYLVIRQYNGSSVQTIFETVTFLVAAIVLTYMTFWMQSHSRTMSADLRCRSEEALDGKARFGLGLLAFQAVGREGLETMVFTLAIVFASKTQAATHAHGRGLLLGAILGLTLAMVIAFVIYKLGRRLNLGTFFRVIGVVLMVFAAGLLADAIENMQSLGWLPLLTHHLWNTGSALNENSSIGDAFHSMLGYSDRPTVLQLVVWISYVSVSITLFIRIGRRARGAPPTSQWVKGTDAPAQSETTPTAPIRSDGAEPAPAIATRS